MRGGRSLLSLASAGFIGWSMFSASLAFAQGSDEVRIRDVSRPMVIQDRTDQTDPLDKKRNVHCKTYAVDMRQSKGYSIELTSQEFNAYLRIEDKDGTELVSNHNAGGPNTAQLEFNPPKDGIYRIMVESVGGAVGNYTFKIASEDAAKSQAKARAVAEAEFRQRDRNHDGVLSQEEMPSALRASLQRWDKNQDGVISLDEFLEFRGVRATGVESTYDGPPLLRVVDDEDLPGRPNVFRAGKLPAGLPEWFAQLDTDGDGQVALWEWRKGGKKLEEFEQWDLNEDGFITAEEVLRRLEQVRMSATTKKKPARTLNPSPSP